MSTENLSDALEACLTALEQGADLETCLVRYPGLADELRPLLETVVQARAAAVTEVPVEALRRGKSRVLQAAAEMREAEKRKPFMIPFWRRQFSAGRLWRLGTAALVMVVFLLTGGTGLVNASSGALPGDQLYQVKRSWEGVRLFLTFDQQVRQELEQTYEQERVHEIDTLYDEGRVEQVNFQGVVEKQAGELWIVSDVTIQVGDETVVAIGITPGAMVEVTGQTDDGLIEASSIRLLATPVVIFTPQPSVTEQLAPRSTATEVEQHTAEPSASTDVEATGTELKSEAEQTKTITPAAQGASTPTKTPKPSGSGSGSSGSDSGSENGNDSGSDNSNDDSGHGEDNSSSGKDG